MKTKVQVKMPKRLSEDSQKEPKAPRDQEVHLKNKNSIISKRQSLSSSMMDYSANQVDISDIDSVQDYIAFMKSGKFNQ